MSFSIGIVGLPNVGKSTLFKALTKNPVDIADYPFTTIHPNVGVVVIPDERLEKVAQIIKPEKITPTVIEFVDIAGLIKNAHKGEGLGNQFLAQIRNCDALVEIVKSFNDNPNIEKDIETIKTELEMKDSESKEEENLLSKKPIIYLLNIGNTTSNEHRISMSNHLELDLKLEEEVSELTEAETKELGIKPQLDQLILNCYHILDLITFYTVTGGKETRAWTLKKGLTALEAGGVVHTDFKEKFIKAEIINWQKLTETKSWKQARELGWLKTIGKEYQVQDGDIIEFKI